MMTTLATLSLSTACAVFTVFAVAFVVVVMLGHPGSLSRRTAVIAGICPTPLLLRLRGN